jgi:uncharacterized repeat protein (TIGR02543 family)
VVALVAAFALLCASPLAIEASADPDAYTVTFDSAGGSAVPQAAVAAGEAVDRPADPSRIGYTFGGWFSDVAHTLPYDFSAPVTGDIALHAKWSPVSLDDATDLTVAEVAGIVASVLFVGIAAGAVIRSHPLIGIAVALAAALAALGYVLW